jgi:hypothetical protein
MNDPRPSLFTALEMEPTLDPTAVKRAYFVALAKHPPHADPEGFRRLRSAYELLTRPGGLASAYAACPIDLEAELLRCKTRFAGAIAAAAASQKAKDDVRETARRFIDDLSRLRLAELCGSDGAPPHPAAG